jgi:hypothetical protein
MTPDLSRVLGVYFGDGSVDRGHGHTSYSFDVTTITPEFAVDLSLCLKRITGFSPKIRATRTYVTHKGEMVQVYRLRFGHTSFCQWIADITGTKSKIPNEVLQSSESCRLEFLSGFFDSEGHVGMTVSGADGVPRISTSVSGIKLMDEIRSLFVSTGFNCGTIRVRDITSVGNVARTFQINPVQVANKLRITIDKKNEILNLLVSPSETECEAPSNRMMLQSELHGDMERQAEMTCPKSGRRSSQWYVKPLRS